MVYIQACCSCCIQYFAQRGEDAAKRGGWKPDFNSHGNNIVDPGKSWNCVFEFLWEPRYIPHFAQGGEDATKRGVWRPVFNSHGNYIVDHGKSWNCVFEFLSEPCYMHCLQAKN